MIKKNKLNKLNEIKWNERPSSSCSFLLSKRFHNDIIDLQWYPKSDYLVSVASNDNQIIVIIRMLIKICIWDIQNKIIKQNQKIWDITLKKCVPIKRIGAFGFTMCKFSSHFNKLFTADLSTTFRLLN